LKSKDDEDMFEKLYFAYLLSSFVSDPNYR